MKQRQDSDTPTRTRVEGREPCLVASALIRPTDLPASLARGRFSPLALVDGEDGFFYIVDGNHRFFRRVEAHGLDLSTPAWVLGPEDGPRLRGASLPWPLRQFREGKISLADLAELARQEFCRKVVDLAEYIKGYPEPGPPKPQPHNARQPSPENQRRDRALAVMSVLVRVLKGVTTVRQEALVLRLDESELSSLLQTFLDGGRLAVEKRLTNPSPDENN
jgi:hypothetical protein